MRLKIAISFIDSIFTILAVIGIAGLIGSFFWFKGVMIGVAIVSILLLVGIILSFKARIVNFYLRKCPYPHEFLSLLEQLDLMEDLEITWNNDGTRNSNHLTKQFLEDNNLATEIGKEKISLPFAVIMIVGSIGGLIYFSRFSEDKNRNLLLIPLLINLFIGIFLWIRGKKQQNDVEPILIFNDKGLVLDSVKIEWQKIISWKVKNGSGESERYIIVDYYNTSNKSEEMKIALHELNIDRIDCLLLLTHFKSKYGTVENVEHIK